MIQKKYPLISVIIPCFNLEKVIGKCLDSVVNQTYKNLQIIVIDDGSNDDSAKVIERYADRDRRIQFIVQVNSGVGAVYNRGLKFAKGEYIYILDGDNYVDLSLLECLYERLISDNSDYAMCGYWLEEYRNDKYELTGEIACFDVSLKSKMEVGKFAFDLYKRYLLQSPCNKLYTSGILKSLYFSENREHMMIVDTDFNLRLLERVEKISLISKSLIHYIQYDINFRQQITSMWKYKYKRISLICEKRLYELFIKYYSTVFITDRDEINNCIDNYFGGRFLQIAQVLFLDRSMDKKNKLIELGFLKSTLTQLNVANKVTYYPYQMLLMLIFNNNNMILKIAFNALDWLKKRNSVIFNKIKF